MRCRWFARHQLRRFDTTKNLLIWNGAKISYWSVQAYWPVMIKGSLLQGPKFCRCGITYRGACLLLIVQSEFLQIYIKLVATIFAVIEDYTSLRTSLTSVEAQLLHTHQNSELKSHTNHNKSVSGSFPIVSHSGFGKDVQTSQISFPSYY